MFHGIVFNGAVPLAADGCLRRLASSKPDCSARSAQASHHLATTHAVGSPAPQGASDASCHSRRERARTPTVVAQTPSTPNACSPTSSLGPAHPIHPTHHTPTPKPP